MRQLQPNSLYRAARQQTSNGFFCSVNHLSGGEVNANHNATHSPSLARKNKTENDSRLLKNSKGNEWTFFQGQQADIALFLQETRIRKIRKIFEENWSIIALNRAINRSEPCAANLGNSVRYTITITFTQSKMCIRFRALSIKSSMLIPVGGTILKCHSMKLQI